MIPFVDLKAQYRSIKPEIDAAVARVLDSAAFVLGPEVAAFEEAFAALHGARFGVAVNSGTSALHLALLALGVKAGDEVITSPFTFVATTAAVGYTGAKPVFVDIDPRSFNLDPARLEAAITPRTRAIIPVHLYGQAADMDAILEIAARHGVPVIEDACQAHLAQYKGRPVGALGVMGCFSFYPGKNLGAYGEGGIVLSNDAAHVKTLRMLRDWGQEQKYLHVLKGYNYRMEGLQGAILGVKLKHLAGWTEARRRHGKAYDDGLAGAPVETPAEMSWARHVYHVYAVRTKSRAALKSALEAAGIGCGIHYPIPIHLLPSYQELGHHEGDFPHAEAAAREVLSLPMYPELEPAQIRTVCDLVKATRG